MCEGPWNGSEQGGFLLLLMAVVSPSLSFLLFVPTQRSDWRCGGEMQQLLHCFSSSWCGTEPKILHCTSKSYTAGAGSLLWWWVPSPSISALEGDLRILGRKSCRANLAPKLEEGLGLQLCPCGWCYPESRNIRFLLAPRGLYFSPELREDTPLPASEWGKCLRYNWNVWRFDSPDVHPKGNANIIISQTTETKSPKGSFPEVPQPGNAFAGRSERLDWVWPNMLGRVGWTPAHFMAWSPYLELSRGCNSETAAPQAQSSPVWACGTGISDADSFSRGQRGKSV